MSTPVSIGSFSLGGGEPLCVFAGPCVIEDLDSTLRLAEDLQKLAMGRAIPLIFKASFDKANRTSLGSYRGPGLEAGLRILEQVKQKLQLPVLTDIHVPEQADIVASVVDVLQVPAFLCRQTDLLLAAGKTKKPVNIKKGQFLAPADMFYAAEKVRTAGGQPMVTERGTTFGYRDLVVDMRSLVWMHQADAPVVFDGTHSVQQPGGGGGKTGGLQEMILPLVRAAVAVGVDGIYLEVHHQPEQAPCDGSNCLSLEMFATVLDQAAAIQQALKR